MKDKKNKKDSIVCRCQDISLDEVEFAIEMGVHDPEELKRFLHIGMGPCQGRTCGRLVSRLLAQKTGLPAEQVKSTRQRPPLVSVPIREFLEKEDE
jgi:bacterioferritin-associated ferredoxin